MRAIAAVTCALFALLLTGCGSSGSTEALTQAQFLKQGNAICRKAEEERGKIISAAGRDFSPNGDVDAQQANILKEAVATYQQAAGKLEELGAPAGKEKKLEVLVAAMEEAAQRVESDPQTATVSNVPFKDANKLAEELELDACVV
jgi:hypothetical protein